MIPELQRQASSVRRSGSAIANEKEGNEFETCAIVSMHPHSTCWQCKAAACAVVLRSNPRRSPSGASLLDAARFASAAGSHDELLEFSVVVRLALLDLDIECGEHGTVVGALDALDTVILH